MIESNEAFEENNGARGTAQCFITLCMRSAHMRHIDATYALDIILSPNTQLMEAHPPLW